MSLFRTTPAGTRPSDRFVPERAPLGIGLAEPDAGRPNEALEAEALADLGVLVVHGIGQQRPGQTLRKSALPLLRALTRWLPRRGPLIRYEDVLLRPDQRDARAPAHATVLVTPEGLPERRLLIAECCWAEEFEPPDFGEMAKTMLGPGAWLAVRALTLYVLGIPRSLARRRGLPDLPRWLVLALALPLGPLVGVAVATVQLAFLLLLAFAALPVPWLRHRVRGLNLLLADVLGDSHLFASDPLTHAAIQTRFRRDLDWVRSRAGKCIVISASQGAAVAFEASLNDPRRGELKLVTLGAGLRKLAELRGTVDGRLKLPASLHALPLLLLGLLGLVVVGASGLAEISFDRAMSLEGWAVLTWGAGLLHAALSAALFAAAATRGPEIDAELRPAIQRWLEPGGEWLDLYSALDPVPSGPILRPATKGGSAAPRLVSRRVVNRLSPIQDHVSYWKSPDDALTHLAAWIDRWTGWGWQPEALPRAIKPMSELRAARQVLRLVAVLSVYAAALTATLVAPLPGEAWLQSWLADPEQAARGAQAVSLTAPGAVALSFLARLALSYPEWLVKALPFLLLASLYTRLVMRPAWNAYEQRAERHLPWNWRDRLYRSSLIVAVLALAALPWELLAAVLSAGPGILLQPLAALRAAFAASPWLAIGLAGMILPVLAITSLIERRLLRLHPDLQLARRSEPDEALEWSDEGFERDHLKG